MLMKQCPNHGVDEWVIVQIFCTRLNPQSKAMVDSMTNGGYRNVPVNEVFRLLDQLSANNSQGTNRRIPHSSIAPKEDTATAQFASMLSALNKRFDVLETDDSPFLYRFYIFFGTFWESLYKIEGVYL